MMFFSLLCYCRSPQSTLLSHTFHFSVTFQLVCLFIIWKFRFFPLSVYVSPLNAPPLSRAERYAAATKNRLCKYSVAPASFSSNKHKACELIRQFVRFRNSLWMWIHVDVSHSLILSRSLAWCCECQLMGSPKLNGKLHKYIFEFMWKPCTRENKQKNATRECYTFMTKISIHIYLYNIRVFKRCRIGNDFVSRRFPFPQIPIPWDWIEWYGDRAWLLIDSRKTWTKYNFSPDSPSRNCCFSELVLPVAHIIVAELFLYTMDKAFCSSTFSAQPSK